MKLTFKLSVTFLFISMFVNVHARPIILITHKQNKTKANKIRQLITQKMHIPSILVTVDEKINPCLKDRNAIMHLCVDKKNNMKTLQIKNKIIKRSFAIFQKKKSILISKTEVMK
ncbi:MAG: hypothetical protein KAQ98_04100 [Bacteriovoracaceae bacterium]|nr:hypothetical protein [Bacteriovoracaceae bacterium]